jgi:hypothetical protein
MAQHRRRWKWLLSVRHLAHSPQSQKNSTVDVAFDSSTRSTATNLPFRRYKKGASQLGFAQLETMFAVLIEVTRKTDPMILTLGSRSQE